MRKFIGALLGATMLAGTVTMPAHAMTRWETTSRGWEIDAHEDKAHPTCSAYREYENGIKFMMGWKRNNDGTNNGGLWYGFGKDSWASTIKQDQVYTITANTDGKSWGAAPFTGYNKGKGHGALLSDFLVTREFLNALAMANAVRFYQNGTFILGLQLDGSQEALMKMLECQKAQDAQSAPQARITQPGNPGPWSVPVVRDGTQITLDGKVNDQLAINFTLDTGATAISITREQANRLGLKVLRQIEVEYADGRKAMEDVVMLDKVSVGGVVFVRNVEALVSGSALLGKNFLDRFGSYEIDNRQAKLILRN